MESKRGIILAIIVFVIVLLLIGGSIYYLTRILRRSSVSTSTPDATTTVISSPSPSITTSTSVPSTPGVTAPAGNLVYNGQGFSLFYPNNWGILTCTTSQNIEFDPYNPGKQSAPCNSAVKPITVLVNSGYACSGQTVSLGSKQVNKLRREVVLQETGQLITEYQWCFSAGGKNFFISHRTSPANGLATSRDDFSSQIEQMISSSKP